MHHDQHEQPIFIHHELDDADLDPYAFRVYCRIARRAGAEGAGCYESVKSMAEGCSTTPKRIRKALRHLEQRGMISRESRAGQTSEITLLPRDRWKDTPCENTTSCGNNPGGIAGGGPSKSQEGGPAKSQDKDTKTKDTRPKVSARPRAGEESDQTGNDVEEKTGKGSAAETRPDSGLQVAGETYSSSWQDPVTGRRLAEMDAAERTQAVKGWPLGCGIADAADHPGVEVHAEFYPGVAGGYQRELIAKTLTDAAKDAERLNGKPRAEAAREVLRRWRKALSFWKGNGHRGRSVKRQLQKFKEIAQEERAEAPGRTQMPQDLLNVGRRATA